MKEIINCPSPAGLPYGFRGKIAKRMHVHPNTVSNILNTGNSHPKTRAGHGKLSTVPPVRASAGRGGRNRRRRFGRNKTALSAGMDGKTNL